MRVQYVVRALRSFEVGVVDERFAPYRKRQNNRAIAPLGCDGIEQPDKLRRHHVIQAFAVIGNERVPINEPADSFRNSIGDASDYHPAVAVADKDNFFEVVLVKIIGYRINGFVQADRLRVSGSVSFYGGRVGIVASRVDKVGYRLKFFSCVPCSMDDHISTHGDLPVDIYGKPDFLVRSDDADHQWRRVPPSRHSPDSGWRLSALGRVGQNKSRSQMAAPL